MATATLKIPQELIDIAAKNGADIAPVVKYDAEQSLKNLSAQYTGMHGDADFGAETETEFGCACFGEDSQFGFSLFKKMRKKVANKMAAQASTPQQAAVIRKLGTAHAKLDVKGSLMGLGKGLSVAAFLVPGGSALHGALSAGDKLLGSTKNVAHIVSNTKALAALGHPEAIRGAQILATVSRIRTAKKTPVGKPSLPRAPSQPAESKPLFIRQVPRVQADALAHAKIMQASKITTPVLPPPIVIEQPGFWPKFKAWWWGEEVKPKITAQVNPTLLKNLQHMLPKAAFEKLKAAQSGK